MIPPSIEPGESGVLNLRLPSSFAASDAFYLTAYGPGKKELFTWSWSIITPEETAKKCIEAGSKSVVTAEETDASLIIRCDGIVPAVVPPAQGGCSAGQQQCGAAFPRRQHRFFNSHSGHRHQVSIGKSNGGESVSGTLWFDFGR